MCQTHWLCFSPRYTFSLFGKIIYLEFLIGKYTFLLVFHCFSFMVNIFLLMSFVYKFRKLYEERRSSSSNFSYPIIFSVNLCSLFWTGGYLSVIINWCLINFLYYPCVLLYFLQLFLLTNINRLLKNKNQPLDWSKFDCILEFRHETIMFLVLVWFSIKNQLKFTIMKVKLNTNLFFNLTKYVILTLLVLLVNMFYLLYMNSW